jgi:GNAT superfamily N-acetyltransferase
MSADPELLALWTRGWALTRGVSPPVWDDGGWRIEVGAPDQVRRFVHAEADAAVLRRADRITEPNVFLKVCEDEATTMACLPCGWSVKPPGFMMTLSGAMTAASPDAEGYKVSLEQLGAVLHCRLLADDVEVARGRIVVIDGAIAVYDRISVDPGHRRRGLGRRVMRTLEGEVSTRTGVLVATAEGRALYTSLGWTLHSRYTTAAFDG